MKKILIVTDAGLERLKSFPGHSGIPGHRGGSLPGGVSGGSESVGKPRAFSSQERSKILSAGFHADKRNDGADQFAKSNGFARATITKLGNGQFRSMISMSRTENNDWRGDLDYVIEHSNSSLYLAESRGLR